jgi:hypothetical protein
MKRSRIALASVAITLLLAGTAGASTRDRVIGSATNDLFVAGTGKLVVDAFSSASGAKPGGVVHGTGDVDGPARWSRSPSRAG